MSKVIFPIADVYIKTRKSNGEVEYTDEAPVKHLGLFDFEPCITASSAEIYANARVAEALAAQASGQDELQPAVDWLYRLGSGLISSDIQFRLLVDHDRASRLLDSARATGREHG